MRLTHGIAALTFAAAVFSPPRPASTGLLPVSKPLARARRAGAPACRVEGVWELVSMSLNGQELPRPGYHERKVVARGQFMWFGEEARRDTITLRTADDTLRAFRVTGGAGTYTLVGTTYTEHLEFFYDPRRIGQSVVATCRTDGDRWYHSFSLAGLSGAPGQPAERIDQGWRRVG